jgi:DNA-binding NarL/FixJ family response regulator
MKILIIANESETIRNTEDFINLGLYMNCQVATNKEMALQIMNDSLPHLVLCSVTLKDECDGLEIIKCLQEQYYFETILLQKNITEQTLRQALSINPLHILVEPIDLTQLYSSLRWAEKQIDQSTKAGSRKYVFKQILSRMEYDVLKSILKNKSTKQIAEEHFISPYTVKNHRHNICKKLELDSGNNAITKWALENGLALSEI